MRDAMHFLLDAEALHVAYRLGMPAFHLLWHLLKA
jgi:hypothetical protein